MRHTNLSSATGARVDSSPPELGRLHAECAQIQRTPRCGPCRTPFYIDGLQSSGARTFEAAGINQRRARPPLVAD